MIVKHKTHELTTQEEVGKRAVEKLLFPIMFITLLFFVFKCCYLSIASNRKHRNGDWKVVSWSDICDDHFETWLCCDAARPRNVCVGGFISGLRR